LYLRVDSPDDEKWLQAKKILAVFDGETPVYVYFINHKKLMITPKENWVDACDVLIKELSELLGHKNIATVDMSC
jgi:DNA polymerase-3 subunit alpha